MNTLRLCLFVSVVASIQSCEIPRSKQPSQPETPTAKVPDSKDVNSTLRVVDGRVKPPIPSGGPPIPASASLAYKYGDRPKALEPDPARIEIAALAAALETPFRTPGKKLDRVVLQPSRSEWEPALLAKGVTIVDRSTLELMQREFFIQEASATTAEVTQTLTPDKNGEHFAFKSPVAGRSPYPANSPFLWQRSGEKFFPMLSGRDTGAADKLLPGKMLPAKWILHVDSIHFQSDDVSRECLQPTGDQISYRPAVFGTIELPALLDGEWKRDTSDPFHLVYEKGTVYFDPATKSLWRVEQAWIGKRVTRDEYINRHTTRNEVHCEECARIRADKSTVAPPAPETTPLAWQCTRCQAGGVVEYFDGYGAGDVSAKTNQAIIEWRWLASMPGVYPVLQPGIGSSGAGTSFVFQRVDWSSDRLLEECRPAAMLGVGDRSWCVVDGNAGALILAPNEIAALRAGCLPVPDDAEQILPIPQTDNGGRQIFRLESEPYRKANFKVAVQVAAVDVRLVNVENSTVALSGMLKLSYLNLLTSSEQIRVTKDGIDLLNWPPEKRQQELLRNAMHLWLARLLTD